MTPTTGIAKQCPRCGSAFVCMHDTPAVCQCAGIRLSDVTRAYLKDHYTDCLCARCLRELEKEIGAE